MWKLNCGCDQGKSVPYVFDIPDEHLVNFKKIVLPICKNYDCLEESIIDDYWNIIQQLECGIQPNLDDILQKISLLDIKLCVKI